MHDWTAASRADSFVLRSSGRSPLPTISRVHGTARQKMSVVTTERAVHRGATIDVAPGLTAGPTLLAALAGLGGAMWAMYREIITAHMGDELMISVIVVIILGGLGSI